MGDRKITGDFLHNRVADVEKRPMGTVIVHADVPKAAGVALYARVSRADQKADLDRQLVRLTEFAVANKFSIVVDAIKEA